MIALFLLQKFSKSKNKRKSPQKARKTSSALFTADLLLRCSLPGDCSSVWQRASRWSPQQALCHPGDDLVPEPPWAAILSTMKTPKSSPKGVDLDAFQMVNLRGVYFLIKIKSHLSWYQSSSQFSYPWSGHKFTVKEKSLRCRKQRAPARVPFLLEWDGELAHPSRL